MADNTPPEEMAQPPQSPVNRFPARVVVLIGLIIAVFFLYLRTPLQTDYLAGGMRVIESEMTTLAPPPNTSPGPSIVAPNDPRMSVEYVLLTRTCDEIEAYYDEAALQAGWKRYQHESTDLDMTWSYAKVAQGYQLTFDLYCVQPAGSLHSDHYDVSMDVQFPYNISFVGGLVAHGIINPYGDARP